MSKVTLYEAGAYSAKNSALLFEPTIAIGTMPVIAQIWSANCPTPPAAECTCHRITFREAE